MPRRRAKPAAATDATVPAASAVDDDTGCAVDRLTQEHVLQPESFVGATDLVRQRALAAVRELFAQLKQSESKSFGMLDQLFTQGLDSEQVYQQLELQSTPHLAWLDKRLRRLVDRQDQVLLDIGEYDDDDDDDGVGSDDASASDVSDAGSLSGNDDDEEDSVAGDEEDSPAAADADDADGDDTNRAAVNGGARGGDRFFSRAMMEAFVREAEQLEEQQQQRGFERAAGTPGYNDDDADDSMDLDGGGGGDEDDDDIPGPFSDGKAPRAAMQDSDEDVDLYAPLDDGSDGDDNDDPDAPSHAANLRYSDFFDPPPTARRARSGTADDVAADGVDAGDDDDAEGAVWRRDDDGGDDDEEYVDPDAEDEDDALAGAGGRDFDDHDDDQGVYANRPKLGEDATPHEQRMHKMSEYVEQLEASALAEKPWELRGEATAKQRPKDSALEAELDFVHNSKLPPVVTEADTEALEAMIKQRILAEQWDDVERKVDVRSEQNKDEDQLPEISQEKSKVSLAEVYEQAYLKQAGFATQQETEQDTLKREISGVMKKLFHRLDQLSNFHFTPKPVIDELHVKASAPALVMEEVIPSAASDAQLLLPEEVQKRQTGVRSKEESSQADRKRDRRVRKETRKRQRERAEHERRVSGQATEDAAKPLSKAAAAAQLKKQMPRNVKTGVAAPSHDASGAKTVQYTKSGQFFAKLADEAASNVAKVKSGGDEPDSKRQRRASSLKL